MSGRAGRVYSVAQINAYIRSMFDQDYLLGSVSVKGEISNCKYHQSGHVYFTLKDAGGAISCILFAGNRRNVALRLTDGLKIVASGRVSVYEKGGTYQLYVASVSAAGLGELYERYEALKKELMEMGMFDQMYKQPIPKHVKTLGVVTAPTGAAVRDIIQISKRRNPGIRIILYPARVQGDGAAESIVRGIRTLDAAGVDVMIIGRGGGSIEDLWAFNEEIVARAVFEAAVPVISAVGHETDTVITDFVADLRAPTPSAAAELAVEDVQAVLDLIGARRSAFVKDMNVRIAAMRDALKMRRLRLAGADPAGMMRQNRMRLAQIEKDLQRGMENALEQQRMRLFELENALESGMKHALEQKKHALSLYAQKLEGASPYRALAAGYALVTDRSGRKMSGVENARAGDSVRIYLHDGELGALVTDLERQDHMGETKV